MKIIKITTQAELDALPDAFEVLTRIQIHSPADMMIYVQKDWDNSSVVARGNSSVEARGNSRVEAWGNSSVVAWDNSSSKTFETSTLKCFSSSACVQAFHNSIVTLLDCEPALHSFGNAQVITQHVFAHNIKSFTDVYPADNDGFVALIKSVDPETGCDFRTGKIKYYGEVVCPDFDPDPTRECGGGLHLSPTPQLALSHNRGKLLVCKVHVDDIVVYGPNISKVRCRKVQVIGPYEP